MLKGYQVKITKSIIKYGVPGITAALTAGSLLTARQQGDRILLLSGQRPVAALSRAASALWMEKIAAILSIRVIAMVRRMAEDGDPSFRSRYHTRQWEVPLVEIPWR